MGVYLRNHDEEPEKLQRQTVDIADLVLQPEFWVKWPLFQ